MRWICTRNPGYDSRVRALFCGGDENDVSEIPNMTRVQRYCLVVGMSCAEVFSVGKLLPRGKLIIKSKPRPSAPPSKSLPARVIVGYIGIRLICVTPMYVAVKYIGTALKQSNPMYRLKNKFFNTSERHFETQSRCIKNLYTSESPRKMASRCIQHK